MASGFPLAQNSKPTGTAPGVKAEETGAVGESAVGGRRSASRRSEVGGRGQGTGDRGQEAQGVRMEVLGAPRSFYC